MKKSGKEVEQRRRSIEQVAIAELQQTGESKLNLREEDAAALLQRVVELLFDEQRHQHKLLYLAAISVRTPDVSIRGKKLFMKSEVVITNPVKMRFLFSFSLKNSRNNGELDIHSFEPIKVSLQGNRFKKALSRELLKHFDVAGITEDVLNNLNEVLKRVLITDHGKQCTLDTLRMKVLSNALQVTLSCDLEN